MRNNTMLEKLTAIAFLLLVGVLSFYAFYPFKPVELRSFAINKDTYCLGEFAEVTIEFTKNIDAKAEIEWYIVDGIIFQLDSPGISRPVGENVSYSTKQIPLSLNPGKYRFRIEIYHDIHPTRQPIHTTWESPWFEVIDCGSVEPNDPEKPKAQSSESPVLTPQVSQEQQQVIVPTEGAHRESQSQTPAGETPEDPTPIKDIVDSVLDPVKGLLP